MKKRLFSLLLALCMVLALLPSGAQAAGVVPSGKCGEHVYWDFKDYKLTITGYGDMSWDSSTPPWAEYADSIMGVEIGQDVTSIGNWAFCSEGPDFCNLSEVTLPDSIKTIGYKAFYGCQKLTRINLPEGLESIGANAFWGCWYLNTPIPDSVLTISEYAFANTGCTSLTLKNVKEIGVHAFESCGHLEKVQLPKSLTTIGADAFGGCQSLQSINVDSANASFCSVDGVLFSKDKTTLVQFPAGKTGSYSVPNTVQRIESLAFHAAKISDLFLPDSIREIGDRAFYCLPTLEELNFTDGIQSIGTEAVCSCWELKQIYIPAVFLAGKTVNWPDLTNGNTSLQEIIVSSEHPLYRSVNGAVFSKDQTALVCVPPALETYTIPSGTKSIDGAFENCTRVWNITIPNSVTTIGDHAFYRCRNLQYVTIPDSVTTIGEAAFYKCESLQTIALPSSLVKIGDYAFQECECLRSVTVPGSVKALGNGLFFNCVRLTEATLERPLDEATKWMFNCCRSLTTVYLPDTFRTANWQAFDSCTSLTDVYFDGSTAQWNNVYLYDFNDALKNATVHCSIDSGEAASLLPNPDPLPVAANGYHYERFQNTRADIARMIWEMAGRPYVSGYAADLFSDINSENNVTVDQNSAIVWAVTNGIIRGTAASTFDPQGQNTRALIVSFLYRAIGSEPSGTASPYADVADNAYYSKAVIWQYENRNQIYFGIADGNKFLPNEKQGECLAIRWKDGEAKTAHVGLEHVYDSGVVTKAATATTAGEKVYTCVHCGVSKTETIPASGGSTAPVITTQPKAASGKVGEKLTFTVAATGSGLSYQWQYSTDNGKTWSNSSSTSTTATCTLSNANRDGWLYRCVVKSSSGKSVTSNSAKVTVLPAITTQPKSASGAVGEKVTFTIAATGKGLTYQWQYSEDGGKTWKTSSSTTTSATCTLASNRDGWLYRCIVKDANGKTVTSNTAKVTVVSGPTITTQPKAASGKVGDKLTFTVAATGSSLTYQWQYSTDSGKTWKNSSSTSTSATCTLSTADRDGWLYRCIVKDAGGKTVTSSTAKVTVLPAITTQPKAASGVVGEKVTFTIAATGKGLTYQWQYSEDGGKTWKTSSSTSTTATCTLASNRNGWLYRCIVKDANGKTVTSNTAKVTVVSGPTITTQPKAASGKVGDKLTFTVAATGSGLTYQWQYSTDSGKTWKTSSSTSASATCTLSTADRDGWLYRCIVKDASGKSVTSSTAKVTVLPAITTQPKAASGKVGEKVTFTIAATGKGLTYQWQYSTDGGKTWKTSSSTSTTATCTLASNRDGWLYRCIVKSSNGNIVTSNSARVTVI